MIDWQFRQSRSIQKVIDMKLIKHHLLAAILLAAYSASGAVLAETATMAAVASAPTDASEAVDAAPAERMEFMQTMGPIGGMGMMLRPGMDPVGRSDRMGQRRDRSCHEELIEQRMDSLETRMDMMQMMLRMMLGS
jgi:hypothetical protein